MTELGDDIGALIASLGPDVSWIDDVPMPSVAGMRSDGGEPTLLVPVDERTGLERRHVEAVWAWAAHDEPVIKATRKDICHRDES